MKLPVFTGIVVVSIAFALLVTGLIYYPSYKRRLYVEAHVKTANLRKMRIIFGQLEAVAISDVNKFGDAVSTGLVTKAILLPDVIRTNFYLTTNDIGYMYWDRWNEPYNVSIMPVQMKERDRHVFEVMVWSNGPNRSNENRLNDDVIIETNFIRFPGD